MSLHIFLVERDSENVGWDEKAGFVIAASSEKEARQLASDHSSDEGKEIWLHPSVKCVLIGSCTLATSEKGSHIILIDFKAG